MSSTLSPWVAHERVCDAPRVRLVCLPFAGGAAHIYRHWHELLDEDVELWPLELPGRATRWSEPAIDDMTVLVREVASALQSRLHSATPAPLALFGHSFGALLAFELGLALEAQTDVTCASHRPALLFASGHLPPGAVSPSRIAHLPDDELIAALSALGGIPEAVLLDPEIRELALPSLRADVNAAERYEPSDACLRCPIAAFGGIMDPSVPVADLASWAAFTTADITTETFLGGHFFLDERRAEVANAVARNLRSLKPPC